MPIAITLESFRFDTRQLTKFPSTYHLRTLFDDYVSLNVYLSLIAYCCIILVKSISDSESSDKGESLEKVDVGEELECIVEGEDEGCEDELTTRLASHGSRSVTEKNGSEICIDTTRSLVGTSSGQSTNRSRNSKKGKRRSHRR